MSSTVLDAQKGTLYAVIGSVLDAAFPGTQKHPAYVISLTKIFITRVYVKNQVNVTIFKATKQ